MIADSREFRIRRVPLAAGETLEFSGGEQPRLISGVSGVLSINGNSDDTIGRGDNVLVPYAGDFCFTAVGKTTVLVTENFA